MYLVLVILIIYLVLLLQNFLRKHRNSGISTNDFQITILRTQITFPIKIQEKPQVIVRILLFFLIL